MQFLTTPEARFHDLKDYPFASHFVQVDDDGLLIHYVDEGPAHPDRGVVLMLHGNPTWSYLYRRMVPICVAAGLRVIAPDLIGFGKSSKPVRWQDHTYTAHCTWLRRLLDRLDLRNVTLFCQDWGSLIGLRVVTQAEERFARVMVSNGAFPTGQLPGHRVPIGVVRSMQALMRWVPWIPVERVMQMGTRRRLDPDELRAYRAPFPSPRYMAAIRGLPQQLPLTEDHPETAPNRAAWRMLERWHKPFRTLFSDGEWITRAFERPMQQSIPGAHGLQHRTVPGRHFVQEDSGPELAQAIVDFVRSNG